MFFSCGESVTEARLTSLLERGGSTPTSPLIFRKSDWVVTYCDYALAKRMIEKFHYARGCSSRSVYTFGLYLHPRFLCGDCFGVTHWIPPIRSTAKKYFPNDPNKTLCLSRMVVLDCVPKNACSFFIKHCMRLIDKEKYKCLVSYADEWQGHVGTIYKASGWIEGHVTSPLRVYIKNGRMVSTKKGVDGTRSHEQMIALGHKYVGRHKKICYYYIFNQKQR